MLLITHDFGVVAEMCDDIAVMYAGEIVEKGEWYSVFNNPLHPYTEGTLKAVPNPYSKVDRLNNIPGFLPNPIRPPVGCRFYPRCLSASEICSKQPPSLVEIEPNHFVACLTCKDWR